MVAEVLAYTDKCGRVICPGVPLGLRDTIADQEDIERLTKFADEDLRTAICPECGGRF